VLPPGGLSDHSMIIGSADLLKDNCDDTVTRCARSWRSFDLDAFVHDLSQSVLVLSPPSDPEELFTEYLRTLTSLLDQHAPVCRRRTPSRHSAPWYDNECRECKRTTRRLERTHHRSSAEYYVTARHAWRRQFQRQRLLFRRKVADYWSITILEYRHDTRLLWSKTGHLLDPRAPCQLHHSANDVANHFTLKVDKVRQSTSCASPPVISKRNSDTSTLHSVTVEETARLLIRSPAKHCPLDPVPTWLLKHAAEQFAPILARLCNVSFQAGNLLLSQNHALVSARLKKSTLDPADLNSYRPLPFASKLAERAVASRFVHHCDEHGLLPARQSAYRRYHLTETAVVIVYNDIVRSIDRGEVQRCRAVASFPTLTTTSSFYRCDSAPPGR